MRPRLELLGLADREPFAGDLPDVVLVAVKDRRGRVRRVVVAEVGEQAAAVDLLDAAHRRDDRLVGRREDTALAAVLPASLAVLVPVLALVRLLLGGAVRAQERVGRNDVLDVGPMLWIERPVVRDRGRHFLVIPPRPVAERDLVGRVPDRARGRLVEEEPGERAAVPAGLEFARGVTTDPDHPEAVLGTSSWKEKFADAWPAFHLKFTIPSASVWSRAVSPVAPAGCTQVCDAEVVSVPLKLHRTDRRRTGRRRRRRPSS